MSSTGAWHPDPYGRHQHRYWDGTQWTEHIADDGVAGIDDPTSPQSPVAPTTWSPPVALVINPTVVANVDVNDHSSFEAIRREWPESALDRNADLAAREQALDLFLNDDYRSETQAARLLARSLAHNLYGPGILANDDLLDTVYKTFFGVLSTPPDGKTFAEDLKKVARLALVIVREKEWQPAKWGGSGVLDRIFLSVGNRLILDMAVAPPGRPLDGDLAQFFAVPPQPVTVSTADDIYGDVVGRMLQVHQAAEAGDEVSQLRMQGMGKWMAGDLVAAKQLLETSAKLGDPGAMKDAGDLASELGRDSEARYWFEAAASAGNAAGMFNMGSLSIRAGDVAAAATWYRKAADAGDPESYAALTQLAADADDDAGERRWARLGAEAGHPFCQSRHGLFLAMDANGDRSILRQARAFLEASAARGDVDAMMTAGSVCGQLGDEPAAKSWFDKARATGNPNALETLRKYGV
jgi:TPR repeat protein